MRSALSVPPSDITRLMTPAARAIASTYSQHAIAVRSRPRRPAAGVPQLVTHSLYRTTRPNDDRHHIKVAPDRQ